MELTSPAGAERYAALLRAKRIVVGLDFDGTLSPIVDDPAAAYAHPAAADTLAELAGRVTAIAIVTGRPVAQALELGDIEAIANRVPGGRIDVLGQYGNEFWMSTTRQVVSQPPPDGLATFLSELAGLLQDVDLDPWLEDKGLAIAVHTRRLPDPQGAFDRLLPLLREAAEQHGLVVEPGRYVVEVRAHGMSKGQAVEALAAAHDADGFVFLGDDLGDVPAFEAVRTLRDGGVAGFLVCSGSTEQTALVDLADLVVPGPDGVIAFLQELTTDLPAR
jgi:trehalose 6-phosphate phosphatase